MEELNKKSDNVAAMFNSIAAKYDFLNHFLSLGIDKLWRCRLVKQLAKSNPRQVLDIATGTGDLAIQLAKHHKSVNITGVDISENMLSIGREKILKRKLEERINLKQANSLNLPFADGEFDAAMVAFGVRNFEDLSKGITEIHRVLKNGGSLYVLEFSMPSRFPMRNLYRFYFRRVLPFVGGIVSGSKSAYTYLPESVFAFPEKEKFVEIMANAGFKNCSYKRLTFGVASIYVGSK
ncbi:MAG TPA: bifunctional demethylmenaquinone methyltransferase/2-methoxy-6-polyprenyl-1,4-benzoquinol methylase UbiE [Tenuifilaceae bacterium]|nr:bifunctional demethylmenaquinone methyltransferase/2-methoxy-6-polyprenyl-1,4-benzoquinol methylase UbiE [Tenuifilaceae bacterium]HPI44139.1 bifunctional demethylmenaquinone methyltransferase/2-methoxy-6-polyprenyl-1,4-benzoquinol methylase UbiE [Tenuifilaceae bacterium]HPN21270.1 bifunctional demethylmenaquinone methyltransferase/2-methoxy-6-polyprenyl-1,4-benzoquinol methylase UbiE [Tenuifilaceae bacterium]HPV55631.1 bifunctional demethylmenaquinone methyltransferase/2-methoxy-6-polyprenyl-